MVGLQYYEVASLNTFRAPEHWEWRRQYGLCESILLVYKIMATEWNRCARVYSIRAYGIHYTPYHTFVTCCREEGERVDQR